MRFTALYPMHHANYSDEIVDPTFIVEFARTAERLGFDAVALTEHPAPTSRWRSAGGHDALDVFTFLGFCAAVTTRIALMPYVMVPGFRSAVMGARQIATLDVLSGGRLIVPVGTGYLRAEAVAMGMDFSLRNDILDESIDVWRELWSGEPVALEHRFVTTPEIVLRPRPIQRPHPKLWVGGNSRRARQRVADWASGWTPILCNENLARTTRTAAIPDLPTLRLLIEDLHDRLSVAGRDPGEVTVQLQGGGGRIVEDDLPTAPYLEWLVEVASTGVTQLVVELPADSARRSIEGLHRYSEEVISAQR